MRVDLTPPDFATHLLSDLTDWQKGPLPVSDLAPFDIPDDAYFEYAWQDAAGKRHPDPTNPNPRLNPWWTYACHLTGPDYRPDPVALLTDRPVSGRVLRLNVVSGILGQERRLLIYSPPGLADTALPHILFQDGKAYYGWGRAAQALDVLMDRNEAEPAHLIFVPPKERTPEYAFNPDYRRFLTDEVLPAVEDRAPCDGRRTAWGASLGGLMSAQLAWERADLFQQVVTQSGAYLFSPDMELRNPFSGNESLRQEVTAHPGPLPDLRWHLDCGTLEWLLPSNEHLVAALAGRGAEARLVKRSAGHNWVNWRNGLADGFRAALGRG